ncbi:hypothetical protein MACH26_11920 [Planctobacterium marinum]|uniref:Uncharacterized protein n=2 Tax=Planctobacterium marinum TaxID=1631968 RepID=A0AA48KNL8_9ALTE|nr:hypothetical protein MACH26_11920 [Planctobacterium marinum]
MWSVATTTEPAVSIYDLNKQPLMEPRQVLEAVELDDDLFIVENHYVLGSRLIKLNIDTQTEQALSLDGINQLHPDFSELRIIAGNLYFFARDRNQQKRLWRFDQACLCASVFEGEFEQVSHVTVSGEELFFVAQTIKYGTELWRAELEENRAVLVHDINIGAAGSEIDGISADNNKLYFTATNKYGQRKVYQYHQLAKQLTQVSQFNSLLKQDRKFYKPHIAAVDGEHLVVELEFVTSRYSQGGQLWYYNIDSQSLDKIADLNHYSNCDNDGLFPFHKKTSVTFIDNQIYYVSNEEQQGLHVWQYDISEKSKQKITADVLEDSSLDISCWPWPLELNINNLINFRGQLYFFVGRDLARGRLWHFDPQQEVIRQLDGFFDYRKRKQIDDKLYLPGQEQINHEPMQLWALDATSSSLSKVLDNENRPLTAPEIFAENRELLFSTYIDGKGLKLWRLNHSQSLQHLFALNDNENTASYPRAGLATSDAYYFAAESSVANRKIWRAGVTGTPQLLSFELPEGVSHYQVSFDAVIGNKVYFSAGRVWQINTETHSVQAVDAINELSLSPLSFFKAKEGTVYYKRYFWQDGVRHSRIIKYDGVTDEAERIYNGPGRVIDVFENTVFLSHESDAGPGLYSYDVVSQELKLLASESEQQCSSVQYGAQLAGETRNVSMQVGADLYLITEQGYLRRFNTITQAVTELGCAQDLFTNGEVLFLLRNENEPYLSTLWQVVPGSNEVEPVLEAKIRYYVSQGGKLFYETIDAESGVNFSVFHMDEMYEQWIAQRLNGDYYSFILSSIQQIAGDIYYFSRTENPHYPANSRKPYLYSVWQVGTEQPLITFDESDLWLSHSKTAQFAGDIWFTADIRRNGFYLRGELTRLHIGTDYISRGSKLDYNGDNRADVAFHAPYDYHWLIYPSGTEQEWYFEFGEHSTDIPVTGDFDGDGLNDLALRVPDEQRWQVLNSSESNFNSEQLDGVQRVGLGQRTHDYPVAADYDGDGITDFAVVRSSKGIWIIRQSSTSDIVEVKTNFKVGDIPVLGDFDGDGLADAAYRNPDERRWYIYPSGKTKNGIIAPEQVQSIRFGLAEDDIPVTADYDGDGATDLAVWRPSAGVWIIRNSQSLEISENWFEGLSDALPFAADFDGDGRDDIALYSAISGKLTIRYSATKADWQRFFPVGDAYVPVGLPVAMAAFNW